MSASNTITLLWSNHRLIVVEIDGHELRLASPDLRFDDGLIWYKTTNLPVYIDNGRLYVAHTCIDLGETKMEIAVGIHGVRKGEFDLGRPMALRTRANAKPPSTDEQTKGKRTKGTKSEPKPKKGPPPKPPQKRKDAPTPKVPPHMSYEKWNERATAILLNRSVMTEILTPPSTICFETSCVASRKDRNLNACPHTVRTLMKNALYGVAGELRAETYIKVLKTERLRWHPDKFGTVDPKHKQKVVAQATELFQHLGTLLHEAITASE